MKEESGENIPEKPQKRGNVEGIVNELRSVLSGLGNAVPKEEPAPDAPAEPPAVPSAPDFSLFRPTPPLNEPPVTPAPPAPPLSAQPSDADFWNGNVLGWAPGTEPNRQPVLPPDMKRESEPEPVTEPEPIAAPEPAPESVPELNAPDFGNWGRPEDDVPPAITTYQGSSIAEPPPSLIEPSSSQSAAPLDRKKSADPFRDLGGDAPFGRSIAQPAPPPMDVTQPAPEPGIPEMPEAPASPEESDKKSIGDIFTRSPLESSAPPLQPSGPTMPASFEDLIVPIPGTMDKKPLEGDHLELEGPAARAELFRQFACIYPQGEEIEGQKFVTRLKEAAARAKVPMNVQPVFVHPWSIDTMDLNAWSKSAKLSGADIVFVLAQRNERALFDELGVTASRAGMKARVVDRRYVGLRTLYADIAVQLQRKT